MIYRWRSALGIEPKDLTWETLSQQVVIGLMGVSLTNL